MPKQEYKCAWCGKAVIRCAKNPKGNDIKNHFCDTKCKGLWQKKQRENLGYTKEWLYEQYITKERSANDIAKEIGRDSKSVWQWMKDYGIETRKRGYGNTKVWFKKGEPSRFLGHKHTDESREKFRQLRLNDGHVPYLKDGQHWLKHDGIHSPAWRGGVTPERQALYETTEWKSAVKDVWKRDNATCQLCGRHQNDERDKKFHIHHIYQFAEYKQLRTNPDNLVLLCPECHRFVHSKKNIDRKYALKEAELPDWLKGGGNE